MVRYGILGGGWAGLLVARELLNREPSSDIQILERSTAENLGGLLRSESIDGFTYDIGGPHILFSRNAEILNGVLEILKGNVKKLERNNFVHFEKQLIPYPFENGIYLLPDEDRARIGLGIIENLLKLKVNPDWIPESFHDWVYDIFGKEMGSRYLEPYNKKIWKRDLKNFDASWVFTPGRLPLPELKDIVYSVSGIKTVGYKEQAHFYYPLHGGIQRLYESLLSGVMKAGGRIETSVDVKSIKINEDGRCIVNGTYEYDRIINTLPLRTIISAMNSPDRIRKLADKLDYNRVIVIGFAINKPAPNQITLYVPQNDIIFHRYTWMSNLVSGSPKGKSNLIVEITIPKGHPIDVSYLIEESTRGLKTLGIISDMGELLHNKAWVHEYGYPVYVKGHNEIRAEVMSYLSKSGILSVGRWGSWHYWNTDKVYEAVLNTLKAL